GELGQKRNLTTTKETYNIRTAGTPISDLPMTIRQAVWVTRRLGRKYIWVDSLCIIQDDTSDWEAEALKMATVYAMAAVTIVAFSA
ncbi:hypothetical protein B0H67DRAFT_473649, partial [Lasiosphaeris hirsuta]